MSKKLLALLLAMIMIVGSFTSVLAENTTPADDKKAEENAEEKTDEKAEEPAKTEEKEEEKKEEEPVKTEDPALDRAIKVLKKAGFITGYSADSDDFKVEKNVKRSEFASMIVRAKGLEASAKALATVPTGFKDVPTNHWANGYIAVAKQQGFVNGYTDGTFRPDRQISYQDMATMLTIALGQAEVGTVYPAGYIVKAQQLGLFNDVNVPAYTDMATRGDVFKMLYNMINCKEFGERKIVKAIVLENSRVENMDIDEVVVEVIKVVQEANWVEGNRTKRGDQHKYKLDKDLKLDAEDLLGKVIDLTVNKDDKIVEVKVDDTYKYLEGAISSVDYKKFGLDGTKYTALLDERYASEDERLYRTYVNNRDYKYEDFAAKYENETYDFARVTVKNGKVIFIDAYKFYDIAPVAEVKDTAVWYYDDARSAAIVRANNLTKVIFNTAKGYTVGSVKEVVKDDVVHLFKDWRDNINRTHAIVKKDARIDTELTKTYINALGESAFGTDGDYWFNDTTPFKPVYSYEGKTFETVDSRRELEPIVGRKVKMLIAIDGSLQLIESDLQWNDGVNGIRRITSSGDVLYLPSTGDAFWAKEGRGTRYYIERNVNNNQLHYFNTNDIVYFAGEGDEKDLTIARMVRILDFNTEEKEDNNKNKYYVPYFTGVKFDFSGEKLAYTENYRFNFVKAAMNSRYITLEPKTRDQKQYRYFDGFHAYYLDEYNNLRQVGNLDKFIADNADNGALEAVVYSEAELKALLERYFHIDTYNFLSTSNSIANTVVFKNAYVTAATDVVYAEVVAKDNWTNTVYVRDAQGKEYTVNLRDEFNEGIAHTEYNIKDIVKLHILKATADKDVKEGFIEKVVIYKNDAKVFVKDLKYRRSYEINGVEKYFDNDTQIFNRLAGDYAQVYYDEKDGNFVRVIRYYEKGDPESRTYVLGRIYTHVNQFEVITKETDINKFYKTTPQTKFYSVDEDGKLVKDYGFYQEPMVEFHKDFETGEIKVVADPKNPDFALEVIGLKSKMSFYEDLLDKAEKAIKADKDIKDKVFPSGTDDKTTWKPIADAVDALLKADEDFNGKVTRKRTAPVRHEDGADKGKLVIENGWATMETTIEYMGVQRVVKTSFRIKTVKEENEEAAKKIVEELGARPFVEVDLDETPIGDKVETAIKTKVKAAATAKGITLQDDDITVKYAEKDYTATITVGTGADAYTTAPIPFEVKSKTN